MPSRCPLDDQRSARQPTRPTDPGRGALDRAAAPGANGDLSAPRGERDAVPSPPRPAEVNPAAQARHRPSAVSAAPARLPLVPWAQDVAPLTGPPLGDPGGTLVRRGAIVTPSRCPLDDQRSSCQRRRPSAVSAAPARLPACPTDPGRGAVNRGNLGAPRGDRDSVPSPPRPAEVDPEARARRQPSPVSSAATCPSVVSAALAQRRGPVDAVCSLRRCTKTPPRRHTDKERPPWQLVSERLFPLCAAPGHDAVDGASLRRGAM